MNKRAMRPRQTFNASRITKYAYPNAFVKLDLSDLPTEPSVFRNGSVRLSPTSVRSTRRSIDVELRAKKRAMEFLMMEFASREIRNVSRNANAILDLFDCPRAENAFGKSNVRQLLKNVRRIKSGSNVPFASKNVAHRKYAFSWINVHLGKAVRVPSSLDVNAKKDLSKTRTIRQSALSKNCAESVRSEMKNGTFAAAHARNHVKIATTNISSARWSVRPDASAKRASFETRYPANAFRKRNVRRKLVERMNFSMSVLFGQKKNAESKRHRSQNVHSGYIIYPI